MNKKGIPVEGARGLPLMACGCVGMTLHMGAHDGLPAQHPSCFTHVGLDAGACTVVPAPDFANRRARCDWYGKAWGRMNECNYDCKERKDGCRCERPSSTELPFFESKPKEPFDTFYCGCHSWD